MGQDGSMLLRCLSQILTRMSQQKLRLISNVFPFLYFPIFFVQNCELYTKELQTATKWLHYATFFYASATTFC